MYESVVKVNAWCNQVARRTLLTIGAMAVAFLLSGATVTPLRAQSYPNKPIRFIVPFPPGATDLIGRIVGSALAERLGQPVVTENRAGAGGLIGVEFAAKAKPDGYTILLGQSSIAISPSLYKKLDYDSTKDLVPISLVARMPFMLLVRPSLPIKSLKELVEYAKANPGKLNYSSSGMGSSAQLASELFKSLAKVDIAQIEYKDAGQMVLALLTGEADIVVVGPSASMAQIQAGKLRALAVLRNGNERMRELPDVPTTSEAGIDNLDVDGWFGILAPAGTPRDIINRLNAEWVAIAALPDTLEKMQNAGVETLSGTPEQFAALIKAEIAR